MAGRIPERTIVTRHNLATVEFAFNANLEHPAREFLESLVVRLGPEKGRKARLKFLAMFQQIAEHGTIPNKSRFSKEEGDLYAFKYDSTNNLMRIACFQEGRSWVLTHGFFKPGAQKGKGKWPSEQIERANRIMAEHLEIFKGEQNRK